MIFLFIRLPSLSLTVRYWWTDKQKYQVKQVSPITNGVILCHQDIIQIFMTWYHAMTLMWLFHDIIEFRSLWHPNNLTVWCRPVTSLFSLCEVTHLDLYGLTIWSLWSHNVSYKLGHCEAPMTSYLWLHICLTIWHQLKISLWPHTLVWMWEYWEITRNRSLRYRIFLNVWSNLMTS